MVDLRLKDLCEDDKGRLRNSPQPLVEGAALPGEALQQGAHFAVQMSFFLWVSLYNGQSHPGAYD